MQALKHDDSHEAAILAVGRVLLSRGDHDAAEAQCTALMNLDPESYKARMLLADCLLQKSEWEAAIYHLEQMLAKQPALYGAIVKLLTLLRRAGRLQVHPRPQPSTLNPRPQPSTRQPSPSTSTSTLVLAHTLSLALDPHPSRFTLDPHPSRFTLNPQPSTLTPHPPPACPPVCRRRPSS